MSVENFQFLQPAWLLLLPVVWLLSWLFSKYRHDHSMWEKICDRHLLRRMTDDSAARQGNRYLSWILAAVLSIGVIAAAGPSWSRQTHFELQSISARVILLELSQAMLVEDVKPDRFRRASELVRKILNTEFNGETGMIVYAGAAFTVSPLSRDANTLLAFLDALDPGTMPLDGARADLALYLAQDLLEASPSGSGQILMIGTGASESELAVQAALAIGQQGHRVSVLAMGTSEGGPLKNPAGGLLRDAQGKFLLSKPDFSSLQRIAEIGRGQMIRTAESSVRTDLYIEDAGRDEISDAGLGEDQDQWIPANDGHWLIWAMLPLVILLFRRNQLWIILLFCIPTFDQQARASDWDQLWQHREHLAYDAYSLQNYPAAIELSDDPMLRGAAHYRAGQFKQALEAYASVDTAAASYNRGNTLVRLQQFPEAILAYTKALELNPQHVAARYNRRLVEYFLEQQLVGSGADSDTNQDEAAIDEQDNGDEQARIGTAATETLNPAEDPEAGAGLGVSISPGQVDLSENFDGIDRELERFTLTEGEFALEEKEAIETWIKALPQASSELFRRKFLRDYQRQTRQER